MLCRLNQAMNTVKLVACIYGHNTILSKVCQEYGISYFQDLTTLEHSQW